MTAAEAEARAASLSVAQLRALDALSRDGTQPRIATGNVLHRHGFVRRTTERRPGFFITERGREVARWLRTTSQRTPT
jgi:hypothetical protein